MNIINNNLEEFKKSLNNINNYQIKYKKNILLNNKYELNNDFKSFFNISKYNNSLYSLKDITILFFNYIENKNLNNDNIILLNNDLKKILKLDNIDKIDFFDFIDYIQKLFI